MIEQLDPSVLHALIGLVGGIVLGLAARMGRFCTLGAIEDAMYGDSRARAAMWAMAVGVGICATALAGRFGWFDATTTAYAIAGFSPLFSVAGGLTFGYGMALSGNCGYGALARLGGGDLRSFVIVLVMGVSAMATLSGPLAHLRQWLLDETRVTEHSTTYDILLANQTGIEASTVAISIGLAIIALGLTRKSLRRNPNAMFWGAAAGLAVASAWVGTSWLNAASFEETTIVSHTFSSPIGQSMIYVMTASAGGLDFAVGSVVGVLVGAFIGSTIKGHFRWEACEDPRELRRQIVGAALMGIGAAFAMGCSIGQGLSALSTLTLSAPIVLISIVIGAGVGLRQIMFGFVRLE